ncbi:MAG: DUF721 domain-containing protein [Ectothiorhodospiraceae bacterium]|nr:DUF721 domain-containing protein [Ectothiorhodospiraceae bacterium]
MKNTRRMPEAVSRTLQTGESGLSGISRHARTLQRWEKHLARQLPDAFAGHWGLGRLDEHALVLVADSPAWASRLRYLGTELTRLIAEAGGPRARRVTVKVSSPAPQPKTPTPRQLSEQAMRCILSAAESQSDPKLRAALLRLARQRR